MLKNKPFVNRTHNPFHQVLFGIVIIMLFFLLSLLLYRNNYVNFCARETKNHCSLVQKKEMVSNIQTHTHTESGTVSIAFTESVSFCRRHKMKFECLNEVTTYTIYKIDGLNGRTIFIEVNCIAKGNGIKLARESISKMM